MTNKLSKNFQQPIEALLSPDVLQAHEERMERVLVQHLKEHGMQFLSCSRQEVAAHEAGHCIALKSIGDTPTSVTISRAQKKTKRVPYEFWIGLTDVDQSHGVAVGPNENINQLKLMTINTLAGIVAEAEIAGRIIPSSSLDEQSIATIYAGWIGQRSDRSTQDVLVFRH